MRRALVAAAVILVLGIGGDLQLGAAASLPVAAQGLTPYRACTLTATPSSTTVVTDSTVRQGSATSNFGTVTTLIVSSGSGTNQRPYVRFDLTLCRPVIPATAIVRGAVLRMYVTGLTAVCRTIDIFDAPSAWTETGLTWNNQPFGTTINNPASGTRTDSFDVGTASGCENAVANTYVTGADVTTDVASFVSGSLTNAGWMLRDDVEDSSTVRKTTFASKEAAVVIQAPQLVVTWVAVP